ncbi:MAG: glucose-1-phosphate thymidylyltransferase [Euryarchaeota archaeon]|nr:glucose-1-phosphate thymidylyltransferase [Euryarchaeota archaeon]
MKALVLAAGEGTRMRPLTANIPKPLLLTAGKPFLQHTFEALSGAGIDEVLVLAGWMEDRLRDRFRDGSGLGIRIRYLEQKERRGTAHAIGIASGSLGEPFLCVNGDIVVTAGTIRAVVSFHESRRGNIITAVEVPNPREYGVISVGPDGLVTAIDEKPERPPGNLANAGLYLFDPEIFPAIAQTPPSPRGEFEITDTLRMLAAQKRVSAFVSKAPWADVGRPWDLLRANALLLQGLRAEVLGEIEPQSTLRGPVAVGKGTVVRNGSYIVGPVSIGRDCEIGPNCHIRPATTIGNGCKVGAGVELKNSIVMDRSHVPHLNYVGDSIIGEGCNLGAGTKVANLRLDEKNVRCTVRGEKVDTGQRKLGVIMGDNVKTGINCTIDAGTVVGEGSFLGPGARVRGFIEPCSWIL